LFWIFGITAAYSLYKIESFMEMFKVLFGKILKIIPLLFLFTLIAYALTEALISVPLNRIWEQTNTLNCPQIMWQKWFLI
jgi:hypothetical protein